MRSSNRPKKAERGETHNPGTAPARFRILLRSGVETADRAEDARSGFNRRAVPWPGFSGSARRAGVVEAVVEPGPERVFFEQLEASFEEHRLQGVAAPSPHFTSMSPHALAGRQNGQLGGRALSRK